jgi:hypothetical protein
MTFAVIATLFGAAWVVLSVGLLVFLIIGTERMRHAQTRCLNEDPPADGVTIYDGYDGY